MRKLLLAMSAVLVLASFTENTNTTILKDIDGTLLQSFPVIEQVNGVYTATFTVDAMTVVTFNTDENGTHIHLAATGSSNTTVTHTITYNTYNVDFNHYFESNIDVASNDNMYYSAAAVSGRPKKVYEGNEE